MLLDYRPVLVVSGYVLLIIAAAMAVPLLVDLAARGSEAPAFAFSLVGTGFAGGILILTARGGHAKALSLRYREAFLGTSVAWTGAGLFACLPFILGSRHLSLVDAVFESVSGLTTTGATVIQGLDGAPASLLLWRALLNWIGGLGIIVTAIAILPMLRIGGMQLFRPDSAELGVTALPRLTRQNRGLLVVYPALTALLAVGFALTGMNGLESVCHAMSALSTGGFSTSDQSLGHFGAGSRWVAVIGMIAGGITFSLFVGPWRTRLSSIWADIQVRRFLTLIAVLAASLTLWNWGSGRMDGGEALQSSIFNTVSILSTTGFHVGDYGAWGGFAPAAFFFMSLIGGCTGSAAGGIKIFRFEVLLSAASIHVRRLLHPHGVFEIEFNRRRITDPVLRSVLSFVMLYLMSVALLSLALAICGLDPTTSLTGAASAIGNVGPGLGEVIGPAGGYHALPAAAKWLLAGGMIAGRLELATVIVVFTRTFWRS